MACRFVAHLTLAVISAALAVPAAAQQDDFTAPRPRAGRAPGALSFSAAQTDEPPKLGVMVSDEDNGVTIEDVFDGSLAASAGVQPGDILFRLAGQRVNAISDIPGILSQHSEPGGKVSITVIREGEGLVSLHGSRAAPETVAPRRGGSWVSDEPQGAFLGVQLGESSEHGVHIAGVIDNSAAWFVGLAEGDVLSRVGETRCTSGEEVAAAVGELSAGDVVELRWSREGQITERSVRVGRRQPENPLGMLFGPDGMQMDELHELHELQFGDGDGFRVFMGDEAGQGHGNHFRFSTGDGDVDLSELHEHLKGLKLHQRNLKSKGLELHELRESLQGLQALDSDGARSMRIEIKDGTLTIDRDGEVEVIELPAEGAADGASYQMLHSSDGALRLLPSSNAGTYAVSTGSGANNQVLVFGGAGEREASAECVAVIACEAVAECEAAAECDVSVECEAAVECDVSVECEAAVECDVSVECETAADCCEAEEESDADLL